MNGVKRLKDPIYGYIDISSELSKGIIDHHSFQRLRRVIQTSYAPLYASSLHSRFVHSLGVFHLGKIVVNTVRKEIECKKYNIKNLKKTLDAFLLACLLHDVGHAPFSHTGEKYYLENTPKEKNKVLHGKLKELIGSKQLNSDIPTSDSKAAAPHEIMSAIVGIKEFKKFIPTKFEQEFFARCIMGYKYSNKSTEYSFLNCMISLLNSKIIDVDRLDYLIRDAFFTGFDTVVIDYERLLTSLTIIDKELKNDEDESFTVYELAYNKNAISVIENVVYAHDAERKWIQNHPVVLYDIYIIQHILNEINNEISKGDQKLFSIEALSLDGVVFDDNIKISLLCDDDVIHLMKSKLSDSLSTEYFSRDLRRHPLWKSEAEYKALFLERIGEGEVLKSVEDALKETEKYVKKNSESWAINNTLIAKIDQEIATLENDNLYTSTGTLNSQIKTKKTIRKVFNSLVEYSKLQEQDCDFVLLGASQFYSGFNKPDVTNINIVFETINGIKVSKFGKIVPLLNSGEKWRDDFFYLFHKGNEKKAIDKQKIFELLIKEFI